MIMVDNLVMQQWDDHRIVSCIWRWFCFVSLHRCNTKTNPVSIIFTKLLN